MSLPQPPYEIEEKTLPPVLIAAVRMQAAYKDCGPAFAKIGKQYMLRTCGPAMFLCYDACYQEIANYDVCFPVKPGTAPADGIEIRELPAAKCVSLIHVGPYDPPQPGGIPPRPGHFLPRQSGQVFDGCAAGD
jgi:hypothetical protein